MYDDIPVKYNIECLKNEDPAVRIEATTCLGDYCNKLSIDPLIGVLDDEDAEVRRLAAKAISKMDDDRVIPVLIPLLQDPDWEVRCEAVAGLGATLDEEAVGALSEALVTETDNGVRKRIAEALDNIEWRINYENKMSVRTPKFLKNLKDEDAF